MNSVPATRVYWLDALRGVAALVVVIHHIYKLFLPDITRALQAAPFAIEILDVIQAQNHNAVLLFFVLSGYSIGLATKERQPTNRQNIVTYVQRRAKRILPLYLLSLLFTGALAQIYAPGDNSVSMSTLAGHLLFLQTSASAKGVWFPPFGLNGPYWSLSYEVFYYALFPIVLRFVYSPDPDRTRFRIVAAGVGGLTAGLIMQYLAPSPFSSFLSLWIVWIIGYCAVNLPRNWFSAALVCAPFLMVAILRATLAASGRQSDTLDGTLAGCVIGAAFCLVVLASNFSFWRYLSPLTTIFIASFKRIGDGSYALYLFHYPLLLTALHLLGNVTPPYRDPFLVLGLIGMVFAAIVLFPGLEERLRDRFRR